MSEVERIQQIGGPGQEAQCVAAQETPDRWEVLPFLTPTTWNINLHLQTVWWPKPVLRVAFFPSTPPTSSPVEGSNHTRDGLKSPATFPPIFTPNCPRIIGTYLSLAFSSTSTPTPTMTRFRPCIDLHAGQVKQIVGGTLNSSSAALQTNYVSQLPPAHFVQLYRDGELTGAHVIMLGPGNADAAREALGAWRGGLQVGGGITDVNAKEWIDAGAEKV